MHSERRCSRTSPHTKRDFREHIAPSVFSKSASSNSRFNFSSAAMSSSSLSIVSLSNCILRCSASYQCRRISFANLVSGSCNKRTSLARASSLMRLRSSSVALLLRFAFFVPVFNLLSYKDMHSSVHRGHFLYGSSAPSRDIPTTVDESLSHLLQLLAARRLLLQLVSIC